MAAAKRSQIIRKPVRVSVGFSPEQLKQLEEIAEQHERSVPWVVRHAVRRFLDDLQKGQLSLNLEPDIHDR